MKYTAPTGSSADDAAYVDATATTAGSNPPAAPFNELQHEIQNAILAEGLTPSHDDLKQLTKIFAKKINASGDTITGPLKFKSGTGGGAIDFYNISDTKIGGLSFGNGTAMTLSSGTRTWVIDGDNLYPGANNTQSLGTATQIFRALYATKLNNGGDILIPTVTGTIALMSDVNAAALQPGDIVSNAGATTTRTGCLFCNGAAVSRTTYATLFARIGVLYGAGDGNSTFNIPDLRGSFLRGHLTGTTAEFGIKQLDAAPNITAYWRTVVQAEPKTYGGAITGWSNGENDSSVGGGGYTNGSIVWNFSASTISSKYNNSTEIRPVNFAMNFFIKY